jgi:hypothetical protein
MTDQQLSELLGELAEPVTARGLSERAWRRAQQVRRRRRATMGAVAAVAVTAGALTLVRSPGNDVSIGDRTGASTTARPSDAPAGPQPSTSPEADVTPPAAKVAGAPAWLSPRPEDESALPLLRSVLPATVDLTRPAPLLRERPLPRAAAAYLLTTENGELDGVLVLGAGNGGPLRRVDLPAGMGWVPDGQGNATAPFLRTSLSPNGRRIAFAQEHEIVVLTLADASWQRYPVRSVNTDLFQWFDDNTVYSGTGPAVDVRTGSAADVDFEPYPLRSAGFPIRSWWGPVRRHGDLLAQAGFTTHLTEPNAGSDSPEVIAAGGARRALLVMQAGDPTSVDSRGKGCCEVISWLDGDTVAFESGTRERNVLAWNTRTGWLARVTRVVAPAGRSVGGSYADLSRL